MAPSFFGGLSLKGDAMPDDRKSEDDVSREKLGPQGIPGKPDVHPKRPHNVDQQMPKNGEFDGHVA
jgi:hypothetical protein